MSVQRSRPVRPAWLYPTGSILTLRDGRKFVVVEEEVRYYHENGILGNPKDYVYSKWKRFWKRA